MALGLVLSRVILAQRLGISWEAVNEFQPFVEDQLYLRFLPDGLFAALACVIVWYRFR